MQILCVWSSLEPLLWLVIAIFNRGHPPGSVRYSCGCASPEDLPIYTFPKFFHKFLENFLAFQIDRSVGMHLPKFFRNTLSDILPRRNFSLCYKFPEHFSAFQINRSIGIYFTNFLRQKISYNAHKARSSMQILWVLSSL